MSSKEWTHGTFDCCASMKNCCCGSFCACCQIKDNGDRLGESGILCCLLSCIFPCIPIFILRGKAREKYNIEGSTADDAICSFCCGCCASIQTANELDANNA
eukprot:TRINITY_DN2562_c0_g1_i1.p1 TRINITY_DN2562_c0_g1~~TRINITY_DN2562_c0_g1_i1.p1  ORF type:complete len:102 (-),score=15.38 TRINITY_DN2562_c0_g1_i1:450-755(-)